MALSEFELIKKYFQNLTDEDPSVQCGIGDDAAIIQVPQDMEVILSIDTLLQDTHFPSGTNPASIAYKALAVNLSDMAAMGALPKWVLLSLSLPENDENWLREFASGFLVLAREHCLSLIGGDISRGPLSITVQIQGIVPKGTGLRRNGAHKNDLIYVTGSLGDAGVGLDIHKGQLSTDNKHQAFFLNSLNRPEISIEAGLYLREIAHSAIDISDGLIADLGHLLEASHVGAEIEMDKIPLSKAMQHCLEKTTAWNYALSSGDDYKLCFSASATQHEAIMYRFNEINIRLSCIGKITATTGLLFKTLDGMCFKPSKKPYKHF